MRRSRVVCMAMSGALGLCATATPPVRAEVVIYRCTDASGAVSLQNGTPCPKGSRQQKKVMETPPQDAVPVPAPAPEPPLMPMPAPPPPVVETPPPPQPPPPSVATPKQPPPALFECRTWDRERYLSEEARPPARCAPLQVTGLDGSGAMAGGTACQMIEDQCQPVADAALCEAWGQRIRDIESTAAFASGAPNLQADSERVRRIVATSTCTP